MGRDRGLGAVAGVDDFWAVGHARVGSARAGYWLLPLTWSCRHFCSTLCLARWPQVTRLAPGTPRCVAFTAEYFGLSPPPSSRRRTSCLRSRLATSHVSPMCCTSVPPPASFRPRVFSTPRRLRAHGLRVMSPLPRTGFVSRRSGVSLGAQPPSLVGKSSLRAVSFRAPIAAYEGATIFGLPASRSCSALRSVPPYPRVRRIWRRSPLRLCLLQGFSRFAVSQVPGPPPLAFAPLAAAPRHAPGLACDAAVPSVF